jgi:hypothetical protein
MDHRKPVLRNQRARQKDGCCRRSSRLRIYLRFVPGSMVSPDGLRLAARCLIIAA